MYVVYGKYVCVYNVYCYPGYDGGVKEFCVMKWPVYCNEFPWKYIHKFNVLVKIVITLQTLCRRSPIVHCTF